MFYFFMKILHEHIVPPQTGRQRLSDYAPEVFRDFIASKKGIKKLIKKGAFTIDHQAAQTASWIVPGQCIRLLDIAPATQKAFLLDLEIVFEDDHLAIINKPGGIPVSGNQFRTIQNALSPKLKPSLQRDKLWLPRPVHRLDAATCGLLLIAKTSKSIIALSRQFEQKEIKKRYRAVVVGKLNQHGLLDAPIKGKKALSRYRCLEHVRSIKNDWLSLVDLFPETGRTHQLRIHLSNAGHPVFGDTLYGKEGHIKKGKGLFLCAVELAFRHPFSGKEQSVSIDPPAKFSKTLEREAKMWQRLNYS